MAEKTNSREMTHHVHDGSPTHLSTRYTTKWVGENHQMIQPMDMNAIDRTEVPQKKLYVLQQVEHGAPCLNFLEHASEWRRPLIVP